MGDTVVHRNTSRESNACVAKSKGELHVCWGFRAIDVPFGTFTPFTDLLYTAPVPSSRSLSPSTHRSRILAPSTHFSTSFFITLCTISAATYKHHICAHRSAYKISAKKKEKKKLGPTLYLVKSTSAVERGFSSAGFVSVADMVLRGTKNLIFFRFWV